MLRQLWHLCLLAASLTSLPGARAAFSDDCNNLRSVLNITNATIDRLEFVANGTNLTFPDNDPTCARPNQVIYGGDICRVALNYSTSNSSNTIIETWLPANWNGRFLSVGNGGISGCVFYEDIEYGTSFGFATVGTNNGHNGTGGVAFGNSPQVVADFAYRSVHTGVVVGKQITTTLYKQNYTYSYYLGCSTGGRQGFKEVQMYPNDFNGVVVGAPAIDFNALTSWSGWQGILAGYDNTSSSFVTKNQWSYVHDQILRQCDGLDGAVDGILEDPSLCNPIISSMICNSTISSNFTGNTTTNTSIPASQLCLNGGQAMRVRSIFRDFYGQNGTLVYPRMQPGAEITASSLYWGAVPFPYTDDWYRYALYHNTSWSSKNMTLQDVTNNLQANLFNISTFEGNLQPFNSTGGKIIWYHGTQDPVITSFNSPRYYETVAANMSKSPSDLDSFMRFFRIGGMGHCSGGPGAWDVGQKYFGRPQNTNNATNNVLLAIMQWVENGTAPTTVTGYNYGNASVYGPVSFSRRHCKYPTRNQYVGPGNSTDPSAWRCVL